MTDKERQLAKAEGYESGVAVACDVIRTWIKLGGFSLDTVLISLESERFRAKQDIKDLTL